MLRVTPRTPEATAYNHNRSANLNNARVWSKALEPRADHCANIFGHETEVTCLTRPGTSRYAQNVRDVTYCDAEGVLHEAHADQLALIRDAWGQA